MVATRVRVVGSRPLGLRTDPVDVTVQLFVEESKTPQYVAVPPSYVETNGLQVFPSSGAVAGLAGGLAQSAGWFGAWGCSACGS